MWKIEGNIAGYLFLTDRTFLILQILQKLTIFLLILASKFGENRIEVSNLTDILFFAYKVFSASLEIGPLCTDISEMEYISSPQHAWPTYAYMAY